MSEKVLKIYGLGGLTLSLCRLSRWIWLDLNILKSSLCSQEVLVVVKRESPSCLSIGLGASLCHRINESTHEYKVPFEL
jgi:hypothetical protein